MQAIFEFVQSHFLFIAIGYVSFAVLGHVVLWVLYLAVMNLKRARDADKSAIENPFVKAVGLGCLFAGYLIDILLNVFVHTLVCVELPKEKTISERLKRYNRDHSEWAWRRKVAKFFEPILDPFDPSGDHI